MVTSLVLALAIITTLASALYLRYERRKLQELLDTDLNVYVYLDEEGLAHPLDVYSREYREKARDARWN